METKGVFLVLEGGDGSGKTTQRELLASYLRKNWGEERVIVTREPGGAPYAESIRALILSPQAAEADPKTLFALFWAARAEHLAKTIWPALREGKIVLCDRLDAATWSYQICAGDLKEFKNFFLENRRAYFSERAPDAYIILDINPEKAFSRIAERQDQKRDHFEKRGLEFHLKVQAGYEEFGKNFPDTYVVNADQTKEKVFTEILQIIEPIIKKQIKKHAASA